MGKTIEQIVEEARQKLGLPPQMAADRIVRVDQLLNPLANTANLIVQAPPVVWKKPGIVIAMSAQTRLNTDAEQAGTEFQVLFGGQVPQVIGSDGSPQFMSINIAAGKSRNWFPLEAPCSKGVPWSVAWRNLSAVATVIPDLYFWVLELI